MSYHDDCLCFMLKMMGCMQFYHVLQRPLRPTYGVSTHNPPTTM